MQRRAALRRVGLAIGTVGASVGTSVGVAGCTRRADPRGALSFWAMGREAEVVAELLPPFKQRHPGIEVRIQQLPWTAAHEKLLTAYAGDALPDLCQLGNTWIPEFSALDALEPLDERVAASSVKRDDYFGGILETNLIPGRDGRSSVLLGLPWYVDTRLLYYRTDLLQAAGISAPPKTWQELISDCDKIKATPQGAGVNCYAGQFQKYEGLTVNAAEAINSAGGVITDPEGKPNVNTPEAKAGLDFLANGFKQGYIAKEALTYKEEESRRAFQEGKLIFLRNWPYVYQLASKNDGSSQVVGKFAVAPLPGLNGPGVSSLGGHALAISSYAKNKKTAADFINFYTAKDTNTTQVTQASLAPVWTAIYDDPTLQKQLPYLATLKASILGAQPRPKVVRYGDATLAIQDAAYGALQGTVTTDQALAQLQTKLEQLTTS